MYERPSTSVMREPEALRMNSGVPADGLEGANGAVDAAGNDFLRAREEP